MFGQIYETLNELNINLETKTSLDNSLSFFVQSQKWIQNGTNMGSMTKYDLALKAFNDGWKHIIKAGYDTKNSLSRLYTPIVRGINQYDDKTANNLLVVLRTRIEMYSKEIVI